MLFAFNAPRRYSIKLQPNDVIPTGNEWIALPNPRASDGALTSFNVLRASQWDGGIITAGVDPGTGAAEPAGRAFATGAGYVADAIFRMAPRETAP